MTFPRARGFALLFGIFMISPFAYNISHAAESNVTQVTNALTGGTPDPGIQEEAKVAGAIIDLQDPGHIEAGKALYKSNCTWYCHGPEGRRGRSPALRERPDLSARKLHILISRGRKRAGKVMPAWEKRLSQEKIWQLVAYIIDLRVIEE